MTLSFLLWLKVMLYFRFGELHTKLGEKREEIRIRDNERNRLRRKLEEAEDKIRHTEGAKVKADQQHEDKLVEKTKIAKFYQGLSLSYLLVAIQ